METETWSVGGTVEAAVMKPLGMRHTTAYNSRFDSAQLAMPYFPEPAGLQRLRFAKNDSNMPAAGGLVSTAGDLARWLEAQINLGTVDGRQVFPRAVMAETQRLQATTLEDRGDIRIVGYTLGWMVGVTADGDTVLTHGGGFSSFRTLIAFSPARRVGIALMVNSAALGNPAVDALAQYAFDRVTEAPGWQTRAAERLNRLQDRVNQGRGRIVEERARRATRPQQLPYPLSAYAGTYHNDYIGTMVWSVHGDQLWVEIGALQSRAEAFDAANNRLRAELEPGIGEVFNFKFDEAGRAVSLTYAGRELLRK